MKIHDDEELKALLRDPGAQGFFEAVNYLCSLDPDKIPPGGFGPFAQESVRFTHSPHLHFPAGDVEGIEPDPQGDPGKFKMEVRFLGLTGAGTPLPLSLVESLCHDDASREAELEYLDLFHHRIYGLAYRAHLRLGQLRTMGEVHPAREIMSPSLAGEDPGLAALMELAPVLCQSEPSVELLELALHRVLADDIGSVPGDDVRLELVPMTGAWVQLDPETQWTLGSPQACLGEQSVLGPEVWVRSYGATLVIRGLAWDIYQARWVKDPTPWRKIRALLTALLPAPLHLDLEFELVRLPERGWELGQPLLGEGSWILGGELSHVWHKTSLDAVMDSETKETITR